MKKIVAVCLAAITITIGLKAFFLIYEDLAGEEGRIILDLSTIVLSAAGLGFLGIMVGLVWSFAVPQIKDGEIKAAAGGVLGLKVAGGVCLSGGCIPGAVIGSVFSIIPLLPVMLGVKLGTFIWSRYYKVSDPKPAIGKSQLLNPESEIDSRFEFNPECLGDSDSTD